MWRNWKNLLAYLLCTMTFVLRAIDPIERFYCCHQEQAVVRIS